MNQRMEDTPEDILRHKSKKSLIREIINLRAALATEREACARVIEEGQETSSTGRHTDGLSVVSLTPRRYGNTAGLAYADAIRARNQDNSK